LSLGYQIAQSCHSVADFSYHLSETFKSWRENSNYKICLAAKDQKSLTKLFRKLSERGAKIVPFYEPDLNNEMTAFTFLGEDQYRKYTSYLPLAGKINLIKT
jgi:hypothetical protein